MEMHRRQSETSLPGVAPHVNQVKISAGLAQIKENAAANMGTGALGVCLHAYWLEL